MKCNKCGSSIEHGWSYCPKCGNSAGKDLFSLILGDPFKRMRREMKKMEKDMDSMSRMEKDIGFMDITPFFKQSPKSSGFTIKIVSGSGVKPKIDVQTFGKVDKDILEKNLSKIGIQTDEGQYNKQKPAENSSEPRQVSSTEEPEAEIKRIEGNVQIEMDVPGVMNEKDVQIKELENSVEVRAFAGDKMYFKILKKPVNFRIKSRQFHKGRLFLVFG